MMRQTGVWGLKEGHFHRHVTGSHHIKSDAVTQAWWYVLEIPPLESLRQEDHSELEASLCYILRSQSEKSIYYHQAWWHVPEILRTQKAQVERVEV